MQSVLLAFFVSSYQHLAPDPRSSSFTRSYEHLHFIPHPDLSAYFSLRCCEDSNKVLEGPKNQGDWKISHDEIVAGGGGSFGTSSGFEVLV